MDEVSPVRHIGGMFGFHTASQQDRDTRAALMRGLALSLLPGIVLVVGLIAFVMPARPPIPTLYGCYRLNGFSLVKVGPDVIAVESKNIDPIPISFQKGKEGYVIEAQTGFSYKTVGDGRSIAFKDFPLGELIPVYISQSRPPSIGLLSDGDEIKVPKVRCPL